MSDWRDIRVEGIGSIQRVVAVFEVYIHKFPSSPNIKAKVVERSAGSFAAFLNVAPLGPDGYPDGMAGLGTSLEEALEDVLQRFVDQLNEMRPLSEDRFHWKDPEDF